MKPQLLPIFPEPIVMYTDIGIEQDRLQRLYDRQEWRSTNSEDNPEYFLKISRNLKVLNDDRQLRDRFVEILNDYAETVMLYENKFHMTTSWFTNTEKNKISVLHNHGNSMFSAVYYFGSGDGEKAKITFERPSVSHLDLKPKAYNVLNGPSHVLEMANDTILIFPSYLKHKVNSHENDNVRKSLAMNFMPSGILGVGTNEIYLSASDA